MSGRYTWRLRLECGHSIIWGPHDNEGNRREAGQIAECEICPNPALAERKIVEVNNVKTMLTLNSPTTGEVIRLDNLIDRLNAALDEDERIAREAAAVDGIAVWSEKREGIFLGWELGAHVHRHDPAAILRKVEGARKILALHRSNHECQQLHGDENIDLWVDKDEVCPTVLALAEMFGVEP